MTKKINFGILFFAFCFLTIIGCKKTDYKVDTPLLAEFSAQSSSNTGSYGVKDDPNDVFKIPVGLTTTSDVDRVISFTVTSSSAVEGTQYTLPSKSITIKAGQVLDSIAVKGLYSGYPIGRKDTLTFTLTDGSVPTFQPYKTYKLILSRYCDENSLNINLNEFLGDYDNTHEKLGTSAYGPYTTSIGTVTPLTATTAEITVENIYDYGWDPITFILDWTDPAHKVITLNEQTGFGDAGGVFGGSYSGMDLAVRAIPTNPGTFSSCGQKFTLRMQLGIAGVGWSSSLYEVILER